MFAYLVIVAIDNVGAQIYHEGSVLHFLHTESALSLGLNTPGAARKKQVIIIMMKKIGFERAAGRGMLEQPRIKYRLSVWFKIKLEE